MKKIFQTVLIILALNSPVFAFESYIVISNFPIKNYSTSRPDIASLMRHSNIFDDKKTLVFTPHKQGSTHLSIEYKNSQKCDFTIKITENNIELPQIEGLDFYKIEKPVKPIVFDFPPIPSGGNGKWK